MRSRLVLLVALLALLAMPGLPAGVADEEPCTVIERDGQVYLYPENCVPSQEQYEQGYPHWSGEP